MTTLVNRWWHCSCQLWKLMMAFATSCDHAKFEASHHLSNNTTNIQYCYNNFSKPVTSINMCPQHGRVTNAVIPKNDGKKRWKEERGRLKRERLIGRNDGRNKGSRTNKAEVILSELIVTWTIIWAGCFRKIIQQEGQNV